MRETGTEKQQQPPRRQPIPAFTSSPIRLSTPPVKIIGSEPRISLGYCLADR